MISSQPHSAKASLDQFHLLDQTTLRKTDTEKNENGQNESAGQRASTKWRDSELKGMRWSQEKVLQRQGGLPKHSDEKRKSAMEKTPEFSKTETKQDKAMNGELGYGKRETRRQGQGLTSDDDDDDDDEHMIFLRRPTNSDSTRFKQQATTDTQK